MAEIQLADVFVEMADTLVDDFDVIDFLHVLTDLIAHCPRRYRYSRAGRTVTSTAVVAATIAR